MAFFPLVFIFLTGIPIRLTKVFNTTGYFRSTNNLYDNKIACFKTTSVNAEFFVIPVFSKREKRVVFNPNPFFKKQLPFYIIYNP